MFPAIPQFQPGFGLQDGTKLFDFVHNTLSIDTNVRAHAGGGWQFAALLDAVVNVVIEVDNAGDSVQLPPTNGDRGRGPFLGGVQILIINTTGTSCQLFGNFHENSTIGGIAGSTGVAVAGGSNLLLVCSGVGVWTEIQGGGGGLPFTGGTLTGSLAFTTADNLTATGSNSQNGSLLITAQEAIITSFPPQSAGLPGVRLPVLADLSAGALGPITLRNRDAVNSGLVYPPIGGQIDSIGTNTPYILPSGYDMTLTPGATLGQWWS